MIPEPLITVVIPVYNRRDLVRRTLDTLVAQTYRPFNIILVDNNSTDGTKDVLEAWCERHSSDQFDITVISEKTPGAAAARNAGLDLVETPWVMFFDSDDTMAPEHISNAMAYARREDVDIVGWNVRFSFIDGTTAIKPFATDRLLFNCIINGTFATQRYMCRTEMVREAGGWNKSVMVWNDIEMAVRILCRYPHARVAKVDAPVTVTVHQTAQSITGMDYHSNGKGREHAMACMYHSLSDKDKYIIPIKATVLAALYAKEGHEDDARRLLSQAKAQVPSPLKRKALDFAYHYTRYGGRGAARIVKPFF